MTKIHHKILILVEMTVDFDSALGTSKVLDARATIEDPADFCGRSDD